MRLLASVTCASSAQSDVTPSSDDNEKTLPLTVDKEKLGSIGDLENEIESLLTNSCVECTMVELITNLEMMKTTEGLLR